MKVWDRLVCQWNGHQPINPERVSSQSVKFNCSRCENAFVWNNNMECMIPWDEKVAETYRIIGQIETQLSEGGINT